jgi:hypothetical protein
MTKGPLRNVGTSVRASIRPDPQASIAFSEEATAWDEGLPDQHRKIVNRRLKKLESSPSGRRFVV